MALTREHVKKIAELARLELSPAEEERHAETISAVLEYMKILNEVNTAGVEPTFQVTGLEQVVRDDEIKGCTYTKELLAQMPATENDELVVPGVFE